MPHNESADRSAANPAMLKLRLALEGLKVPGAANPGESVELVLEDGTAARARLTPQSPLAYLDRAERSVIHAGDFEYPARLIPTPEFASRQNARGVPLGEIVQVRGLYATVALGGGCGAGEIGRTCALCLGRELTAKAGEWWSSAEMVEAIRAAFSEGAAELIHINIGYLPGDDAGVERVLPYIAAAGHYFDATICVTMHPPAILSAIDRTYAMGVDAICYSLEAPDAVTLERNFPGRARFFGRDRYLAALARAAKVFPRGAVWSRILADLAAPEVTKNAILELASMGVTPLLGCSPDGPQSPVRAEDLAPACAALFESTLAAGIPMGWASDISTALSPLDARHFVAGAPQLPALLHQLSRNRIGAIAARSLARLRRRLRVRSIRASFDSSQL